MGWPGFLCPLLQTAEGVPKVYFNNLHELIVYYRKRDRGLATQLRFSVRVKPRCIKLQDLESAEEPVNESMYLDWSTCINGFIYFKVLNTCAAISLQPSLWFRWFEPVRTNRITPQCLIILLLFCYYHCCFVISVFSVIPD